MTPAGLSLPKNTFWALRKIPLAFNPGAANRLLRTLIRLCDFVLMGVFRLPTRGTQSIARRIARTVGDSCAGLLARTSNKGLLPVQRLVGPDWTIIFVGSDASKREVRHLFFADSIQEQTLEDVSMWTLARRLPQWLPDSADLVICEIAHSYPRRFNASITFSVPSWIDQTITLPASPSDLLSGRRTGGYIKRCIKEGYAFEITQSQEKFDYFYYDLHAPYVARRFGERAFPTPYEDLKHLFRHGALLQLTLNQVPVAGRICYTSKDTLFAADVGVSGDEPDYWKQGGLATLDWYTILWAYDLGVKNVNFDGTRAWHSDGVFEYKRLWGARPARRSRIHTDWTFLADRLSRPLQCRLNEIGFISEIKNRLYGVYVTDTSSTLTKVRLNSRLSAMKKRGLDGLVLVSPLEQTLIHAVPPRQTEKQVSHVELAAQELGPA